MIYSMALVLLIIYNLFYQTFLDNKSEKLVQKLIDVESKLDRYERRKAEEERWEYTVVIISRSYDNYLLIREDQEVIIIEPSDIQRYFNNLGSIRWKLVLKHQENDQTYYWFIRKAASTLYPYGD